MNIIRQPLSWYVDKLDHSEPFTSLLFGDGEFMVAAGKVTGRAMQNGEVVTSALAAEMRASLDHGQAPSVLFATDPFIADPSTYGGRDVESVKQMHENMVAVGGHITDWYDGTVWEKAAMGEEMRARGGFADCKGDLGPLIRALNGRDVVMVANQNVLVNAPFHRLNSIIIPNKNAVAEMDNFDEVLRIRSKVYGEHPVYVVCAGMMTIPLIMRLRRHNPNATYLDLGSTFDVFARIGSRGWQSELYEDEAKYQRVIREHLENAK